MSGEKGKLNELLRAAEKDRRFILLCALIGLVSGALAIAFHLSIFGLFKLAWRAGGMLGEENRFWLMPLIPAAAGFIVGICIKTFAPQARGGGIPQTKIAFFNRFGVFKAADILNRFIVSAFYCGMGNSAGKEGPTVHLCAASASVLAQKFKLDKDGVQSSVPIGVAAGIAASFNSPLSAISFVFEEFFGGFGGAKSRSMGAMVIAVVAAAALARILLGENPAIPLGSTEFQTGWWMLCCLPIALAAGLSGHLFIWLTIKIKKISMSLKRIPLPVWLALGGLFTGASGMYAYGVSGYDSVFSIGYGVLPRAFAGDVALKGMFVIFAFKFLTTSANYALGGSGGIFSGALVIGGMLGGSIGALMCAAFGLDPSVIGACLMMGVGACIASIVRCPITSILMIFELTLNYSLILPILAGNCAAYFISRRLSPLGVYDSFLLAENVALKKLSAFNGRRDWAKIPVGAIATFHPSTLSGSQTAGLALKALSGAPQTFSAYPVLGDAREFIGTVRLEDIKRPENSDKKISEILRTGAADFIEPSKSISEAANIIIEKDALMLPLISNKNPERLIGIITLHDIARQQNASEKELF